MRVELQKGVLELDCDSKTMSHTDMAIAAHVSSAISLKRIADALEVMHKRRELTNLTDVIGQLEMTVRGLTNAR